MTNSIERFLSNTTGWYQYPPTDSFEKLKMIELDQFPCMVIVIEGWGPAVSCFKIEPTDEWEYVLVKEQSPYQFSILPYFRETKD